MVAKGSKRKVAEVVDVVADKCNNLANALESAPNLPAEVVAMLVEVLPYSLCQPKDKRHRFQEQAIQAVDNVLQEIEGTLKKKIDDTRNNLTAARDQAAPSEALVAATKVKLQEDSLSFTKETKTLAESALNFRAARKAVEDAKVFQQTGDQDLKVAAKQKEKLQAIIDELIEPLKSGVVPEADVEKSCKTLLTSLKVLEFDEAMLMVLGSALAKVPGNRGDFDLMAIDQLDKYMAKHISPIEATLQAGEEGRAQRAQGVKLAEDALEQSVQAQKLRADDFESAWKAKKDDEVALETAKRGLKDLATQTKSCEKALYNCEAEADVFHEFARTTFLDLKDRTTPEPVVELEKVPDAPMAATTCAKEEAVQEADVVLPMAIAA